MIKLLYFLSDYSLNVLYALVSIPQALVVLFTLGLIFPGWTSKILEMKLKLMFKPIFKDIWHD